VWGVRCGVWGVGVEDLAEFFNDRGVQLQDSVFKIKVSGGRAQGSGLRVQSSGVLVQVQ